MHSYDTRNGRRFHTNGAFTGEVIIQVSDAEVRPNDGVPGSAVTLDWTDLLDMVAAKVHDYRKETLDDATAEELLGLPAGRPAMNRGRTNV